MDDDITKVNRVQNYFKNDYDANDENLFFQVDDVIATL